METCHLPKSKDMGGLFLGISMQHKTLLILFEILVKIDNFHGWKGTFAEYGTAQQMGTATILAGSKVAQGKKVL